MNCQGVEIPQWFVTTLLQITHTWKTKTKGFLVFLGCIELEHWPNGLMITKNPYVWITKTMLSNLILPCLFTAIWLFSLNLIKITTQFDRNSSSRANFENWESISSDSCHPGLSSPNEAYLTIPAKTFPKTTCFPSSHVVLTVVIKNCEPFVSLPAFAIDKYPGP